MRSALNSLSHFSLDSKRASEQPTIHMTEIKTYVIGPLDSRLELGQTEMDLNTEHDLPVLLPALARHCCSARS